MSRERRRNEIQHYQPPYQLLTPQEAQTLWLIQQQQYGQMMPPPPYYHPQPMQPYEPPRPTRKRATSGGNVIGKGMIAFMLSWGFCAIDAPGLTLLTWALIVAYWIAHILGWGRRS